MYLTVLAGRAAEKTSEENQVQFRTLLICTWLNVDRFIMAPGWATSQKTPRWDISRREVWLLHVKDVLYFTCLVAPRGCRGNVRTLQLNLEKGTWEYNFKPRFLWFISIGLLCCRICLVSFSIHHMVRFFPQHWIWNSQNLLRFRNFTNNLF